MWCLTVKEFWVPVFYKVTLDGHPLKQRMSKKEAYAMAERWQGQKYKSGLLKGGDKGDWVEVSRDTVSEREFDTDYDRMKRGSLQPVQKITNES